ncbi:MAG: hypothetical protein IJ109_01950 [Firmicutes bacterium]|nr:hypothetical protein [Bacillota bacterium]
MKHRITSLCICAALCVILGIAFTACGGNETKVSGDMTPGETVSTFLDAFKNQDEETLKQVYAGESNDFLSTYEDGALDEDIPKEILDGLLAKWFDFDYKVEGEQIAEDGKTASVDVTITTYDMTKVFNNFYQEFMSRALEQFSGSANSVTEEDYSKMAYEILQEELGGIKDKDHEGKASLTLTKSGDQWIVDEITEDNKDFLNAITGGLMDVLNDVVNTLGAGDDGE